jgi:hypothetical protein
MMLILLVLNITALTTAGHYVRHRTSPRQFFWHEVLVYCQINFNHRFTTAEIYTTFYRPHTRSCKILFTDARYLGQVVTVVSWGQEPNSTTTTGTTPQGPAATNATGAGNTTAANTTTTTTTTPAPGRRRRAISTGTRNRSSYLSHNRTS